MPCCHAMLHFIKEEKWGNGAQREGHNSTCTAFCASTIVEAEEDDLIYSHKLFSMSCAALLKTRSHCLVFSDFYVVTKI